MTKSPITVVAVACIAAAPGCVTTGSTKDEPRSAVRFASPTGAKVFYEAYITSNYTRPASTRPYLAIGVTVPVPYHHLESTTDNVFFNAAVAVADANHDGVISDVEADQYARRVTRLLPAGSVAVARQ